MNQRFISKFILLMALSIICMIFFYQCHTASSSSQKEEEIRNNKQPLRLDDIKEGTMVRKVAETGLYKILPQLETNVQINIEGMVASTTVDQVFTNSSGDPVEAIYVFPLPQRAAVHDMKMLINDRLIQGVMKEKKAAKGMYEKAKKEGKRAGLTEQERPNIFTNSVANIMPGDRIIVRLQYVEKLIYEEGSFRLRYPMVVAPRYIPGKEIKGYSGKGWSYDTDVVPDASRITPPVVSPERRSGNLLSLKVNINAGLPVSSINSVSHDIHIIQVDERAYRVELKKKKAVPNKDFILEYQIKSGSEPKAALFAATKDDDDYFMLMAVPPVSVEKDKSIGKEVIFVLDISGSMAGTSIQQAKAGLMNALNLMGSEDYFNIIAFNDRYEAFAPFSVEASTGNIIHGTNYVNNLTAEGGTEAQQALKHAMNMIGHTDALHMIIFLTDGSVGNENQLVSLVNEDIGESRLFTVGIGPAPNGFLLEKVSQYGRGTFTYISDIEEVQIRMNDLFSKIEHPVLMDLKFHIPDKAELYPAPIPDLFAGQPLIIFGKVEKLSSQNARLSGRSFHGDLTVDIPFKPETATAEPAIPSLWARSRISNLMDDYRLGNEELKEEIIDLAIEHTLMTEFTSFVAVEHKMVNTKGESRLAVMPAELPEGWKYEKIFGNEVVVSRAYLPQTASSAPLIAWTGLILISSGAITALMGSRFGDKRQRRRKRQQ